MPVSMEGEIMLVCVLSNSGYAMVLLVSHLEG